VLELDKDNKDAKVGLAKLRKVPNPHPVGSNLTSDLTWVSYWQIAASIDPRLRSNDNADDKVTRDELRQGQLLGEGSSCQVFRVDHDPSGTLFALKIYDKVKVDKLDKRHKNTKNQILMERQALLTVKDAPGGAHPGLVKLHHTFQDSRSLYLLMDYEESWVELWDMLVIPRPEDVPGDTTHLQIGLPHSVAKFYFAQMVSGVSALHNLKLIHRDVKPENVMVCSRTGRLTLIDFGTCKNLGEEVPTGSEGQGGPEKKNGPDFVGTPEYMCPEAIENGRGPHGPVSYSADLWALGAILPQLLTGILIYKSRSEYLTFERVRELPYKLPRCMDPDSEAAQLSKLLLAWDPKKRLGSETYATGHEDLKAHPYFEGIDWPAYDNAMAMLTPPVPTKDEASFQKLLEELSEPELEKATCGPLSELDNFSLWLENGLAMRRKLNRPPILEAFYPILKGSKPAHGRFLRARHREYFGLSYHEEMDFTDTHWFAHLADPLIGEVGAEEKLIVAIESLNKIAPKASFVSITGRLTLSSPCEEGYEEQMASFQDIVSMLKIGIPILLAGAGACGGEKTAAYRRWCGDEYYTAWCGGTMIIVSNGALLKQGQEVLGDEAMEHSLWLRREMMRGKCCAKRVIMFSSEGWYHPSKEEEEKTAAMSKRDSDSEEGEEKEDEPAMGERGEEAKPSLVDAEKTPREVAMEGLRQAVVGHAFTGNLSTQGERGTIRMPHVMYGQVDIDSFDSPALGLPYEKPEKPKIHEGNGVRVTRVFEQGLCTAFHRLGELPNSARLLPSDYEGSEYGHG